MCLEPTRAERAHGDRTRNALRQAKNKEREAVASGKKPYFLKGSEKKRLSMEQRYVGDYIVFLLSTSPISVCDLLLYVAIIPVTHQLYIGVFSSSHTSRVSLGWQVLWSEEDLVLWR